MNRFATTILTEHGEVIDQSKVHLMRSYDHTPCYPVRPPRGTRNDPPRSDTGFSDLPSTFTQFTPTGRETRDAEAKGFEVWEVARAATAAPFYFDPFHHPVDKRTDRRRWFEDGGFVHTNNPTEEGIQEIEETYGGDAVGVVVSVGTSRSRVRIGNGIKQRMKRIANFSNDPETVHHAIGRGTGLGGRNMRDYFRLNDENGLDVKLDEWRPRDKENSGSKTLRKIKNGFNEWAAELDTFITLRHCAELLVQQRRNRTLDADKWEQFSTGSLYRCRKPRCQAEFQGRVRFHDHLVSVEGWEGGEDLENHKEACKTMWTYQKKT